MLGSFPESHRFSLCACPACFWRESARNISLGGGGGLCYHPRVIRRPTLQIGTCTDVFERPVLQISTCSFHRGLASCSANRNLYRCSTPTRVMRAPPANVSYYTVLPSTQVLRTNPCVSPRLKAPNIKRRFFCHIVACCCYAHDHLQQIYVAIYERE